MLERSLAEIRVRISVYLFDYIFVLDVKYSSFANESVWSERESTPEAARAHNLRAGLLFPSSLLSSVQLSDT